MGVPAAGADEDWQAAYQRALSDGDCDRADSLLIAHVPEARPLRADVSDRELVRRATEWSMAVEPFEYPALHHCKAMQALTEGRDALISAGQARPLLPRDVEIDTRTYADPEAAGKLILGVDSLVTLSNDFYGPAIGDLATLYLDGVVVPRDLEEAYYLVVVAKKAGVDPGDAKYDAKLALDSSRWAEIEDRVSRDWDRLVAYRAEQRSIRRKPDLGDIDRAAPNP